MIRFASCAANDSDTDDALLDLLEQAEAAMEEQAHLAIVHFGPAHTQRAGEIGEAILARLSPRCLMGGSCEFAVGGGHEIEEPGGISLLIGHLPGAKLLPVRLDADDLPGGNDSPEQMLDVMGVDAGGDDLRALLGIAEPFSFPVTRLLDLLNEQLPGLPMIGGVASAGQAPGQNRLLLDDQVYENGFVGVSVGGDVRVDAVVSQGCRPIWQPLLVTRADGNALLSLGGKPALKVLRGFIEAMNDTQRQTLGSGVMIGRAVSEYREHFGPGDFLIRSILGVNEEHEAIGVGDRIRVGTTVQFHVRDAGTAHEDLLAHLAEASKEGTAAGAFLVTCNGRGTGMFNMPDHDVAAIERFFPGTPVAGFFAAGELGPVAGQNHIHGHTACIALFRSR